MLHPQLLSLSSSSFTHLPTFPFHAGSTAVGICTKQGVILAVEKRISSPLLEPTSVEKIMEVDTHIGAAMSGLMPDARTLVDPARVSSHSLYASIDCHRPTYPQETLHT